MVGQRFKRLLVGLFGISLFLMFNGGTHAQNIPNGEDYYTIYYEDQNPNRLDIFLLIRNICLEPILQLNPDLVINNVAYGTQIRIPNNHPPCYDREESAMLQGDEPRLKYFEAGEWLDTPYYSDEVVYIRKSRFYDELWMNSLEAISLNYNICMDDLLAENILLHDLDRYWDYAYFSIDVFIPTDAPPCDLDWTPPNVADVVITPERLTPLGLVEDHNICDEELYQTDLRPLVSNQRGLNRESHPPCYNDAGQRLIYFDETGKMLDEPIYSDLPVYVASAGESAGEISEKFGVCVIDFVRINGFLIMPLAVDAELFIPPARPCPDDIILTDIRQIISEHRSSYQRIYEILNICTEILAQLNPQLDLKMDSFIANPYLRRVSGEYMEIPLIIPAEPEPCYTTYNATAGQSIYAIEQEINICHELFANNNLYTVLKSDQTLFYRLDAPPCYNEQGQRLIFTQERPLTTPPEYPYSDMAVHLFKSGETVYSISQQYNVCVHDILANNQRLVSLIPPGFPTFIPNTRPCYDEETGRQLIYEDADGNPLDPPQVSDQLIHYGSQGQIRITYYYNICQNRLIDANRAKIQGETNYLGWIIPTDRPPCYDQDLRQIFYVCYDQAIDFTRSYRGHNPPIRPNVDGAHCYDVVNREMLIWYDNAPYIIHHYGQKFAPNVAFTAWCYGVSLDAIQAINADPVIQVSLPRYHDAIPQPTRECYIDNPDILDGHTIHRVEDRQTLYDIGKQYNMPYQMIAYANDITSQDMIWKGQALIIPKIGTWNHIYFIGGIVLGVVITSLLGGVMIWQRNKQR